LNRIQEGARVAFELMSSDIRSAGGGGCSSESVVVTTDAVSLAYADTPIQGSGTELTLVSGEDASYRVTASSNTSVTLDSTQVPDATDLFESGDMILLCNARKSFIVEATSVGASTITFPALPDSYDLRTDEHAPPASVMVARLRNTRWYVADNPRGGSSLYVERFGQPEEVADGVASVAFTYLSEGANTYVTAPATWNNITGIRTTLVLTGDDVDGTALRRTTSNVVNVRSRTL
jgi:type IV pilus assembly protein PilW